MREMLVGDVIEVAEPYYRSMLVAAVSFGDNKQAYVDRRTTVLLKLDDADDAADSGHGVRGFLALRIDIPRGGGNAKVEAFSANTGWVPVWTMLRPEHEALARSAGGERAVVEHLAAVALAVLT